MAADEDQLEEWWGRLTEEQQTLLKQAVQRYPVDSAIVGVLVSTRCPIPGGWVLTSWTSVPDSQAVSIHGALEGFIESKLDDEN
ncbi:hypothetical protein A5773_13925 [Mycobacterium sp. 852014-52450_SCH5900713]|uniref:hypothetical protein n=1 Tax=Mycobacterium sp. 852014-52450_SCH5900713 TaxID=1834116 RepID=UPI0007FF9DBB|nr:hypothetical protein [Mycobacterium sp. 852014-52450_SCH5900713]OBF95719.1 hypothetical protein A5773_13925 [Mycobacterium sp. 852014-52450_SCH5900713]